MTTDRDGIFSIPPTSPLTRRHLLTLVSASCAVSLTGCGGGGGDAALASTTPTSGTGAAPEALKALAVTTAPGPAVAADFYDRGVSTSAMVTAATGGTMALPNGETLIIPAGALAADTLITVTTPTKAPMANQVPSADAPLILKYSFSPAGTRFSQPVTLRRPLPALTAPAQVRAYTSSGLNPMLDAGSEQTNWQECLVPAGLPSSLDMQLSHFTFVFAVAAVEESAYLVLDIPPKYLQVGDLVFALTSVLGTPQWRPGHVGALVKSAPPFQKELDDTIVHSPGGTVSVSKINLNDWNGDVNKPNFRFGDEHIYLGPRRAFGFFGDLTDDQKNVMVSFLSQQIGKGYSIIGDTLTSEVLGAVLPGDFLGEFKGTDRYSCVSLVEAALKAAGRELLNPWQHAVFSTPWEEFHASSPIPEITVHVGELVELPVYGVQVTPDTIIGLAALYGSYTRNRPYSIYAEALPPDARFDSVDLPADLTGKSTTPGYMMKWTPQPSDAGKAYKTKFHLTGDPLLLGLGPGVTQYLSFKVVGSRYTPTLLSIDQGSSKSINSSGAVLYGRNNGETGAYELRIVKGGADKLMFSLAYDRANPSQLFFTNLNDSEHFAYFVQPQEGPTKGFLYKDGVSFDLGTDPSLAVRTLAINNNDEVVAVTTDTAPNGGKARSYSIVVSRDTINGRRATALSADLPEISYLSKCVINSSGQVAIEARTGDPDLHVNEREWIWLVDSGKATVISSQPVNSNVPYFSDRAAMTLDDFNDAGVMLLHAQDNRAQQADPNALPISVGLTWQAGVFKPIGSFTYSTQFGSYTASGGAAITAAGQVLGGFVYNADNTSAQLLEDLIDYTSDVPKGIPIPILSGRAQLSFVCANKAGQIVITLDIPQTGIPDRKTILALLTPN